MPTMEKQPVRLNKDPIIESIIEIRFTGAAGINISDLLPGMLFAQLRESYPKLETLPVSQIPIEIRKSDPNLHFKPIKRLVGGNFFIAIGDNVVSISCTKPYVGWGNFQPKIVELIEVINRTGLVSNVSRVSAKYLNLIPEVEGAGNLGALKASVQLGDHDMIDHNCTVRADMVIDGILNIVQIMTKTTVQSASSGEQLSGLILDIDCIYECKDEDFWANYEKIIERVRQSEKSIFFSMLTESTLNGFDPVWEE